MIIRKKGTFTERNIELRLELKSDHAELFLYTHEDDNTPTEKHLREIVAYIQEILVGNYRPLSLDSGIVGV